MKRFIPRFLTELLEPKLKCARVGHDTKEIKVKIRKPDNSMFWVVVDYWRINYKCKRCGETTAPEIETFITGYNKCSMPSSMWDEMRDKGFTAV